MIGQRLLHYEIIEKLGEGGMGVVYKARDTHLDRLVALKVLPAEKMADASRKARFTQEARAASALNHPNIVHLYDIATENNTDFIAMEHVSGKSLDQLIPRQGMRLNEVLKIAIQIADALARAHAAGIVHRDLKPSNVMVDDHGTVKLIDFGLAKLVEQAATGEEPTVTMGPKTEEGTVVGTAAYLSPERAEGRPTDTRSDIFAFGAVLYEMLSGRRAFQGGSRAAILAAVLREEPSPLAGDIPLELRKLVVRCLRKDPERRFQHIDDAKVALVELKEDSDSGKLAGSVSPVARPARTLLWVAVGGALVILLVAAGWFLRPRPAQPSGRLQTAPLTANTGWEFCPTFSPEGNRIAYAWLGGEQQSLDIYVKQIGVGEPLRLTTDPAPDHSPAWSPDGNWIAFLRVPASSNLARVMLIPALGGTERAIGRFVVGAYVADHPHLAWTPDGKWLAVSHSPTGDFGSGLTLLSPETREQRQVVTGSLVSPVFSPNGRRLAYVGVDTTNVHDLYVADLADDFSLKRDQRLTTLSEEVASPVWTVDGREILFSSGPHLGQRSLWRIAATPGAEPRREAIGENAFAVAIAPGGRRLAYARKGWDADLWRIQLRNRTELVGAPVRFMASARHEHNPTYSADGKRLVFNSHRSGTEEVYVANADGSELQKVTDAGGPMVANPRWSPDGQSIAIHSTLGGMKGIDLLRPGGGVIVRLVPRQGAQPTWSRDGKFVYFGGDNGQLLKIPREGGTAVEVTKKGGRGPAFESADGQYLYYTNGRRIWRMPLGGGEEVRVLDEPLSSFMNYALVDDGLYLVAASNWCFPARLLFFEFGTKRLTEIMRIPRWALGLAVSPDGTTLLYSQGNEANGNVMVVENFR